MVAATSTALAIASGLPLSIDSSRASSSAFFSIRSARRLMIRALSGPRELAPRAVIIRRARCFHRDIDIGGVGFGHLADFLAGGGINGGERLAGLAVDPAVVDQKFSRRHCDLFFRGRGQYRCHACAPFFGRSLQLSSGSVRSTRRYHVWPGAKTWGWRRADHGGISSGPAS